MNILVKEIDRLESRINKGVAESRYVVYLRTGEQNIEAFQVNSDESKDKCLDTLIKKHFNTTSKEEMIETKKLTYQELTLDSLKNDPPMVLVFNLDRETMGETLIFREIRLSVERYLDSLDSEVVAFFLPTDDKERIDCINPRLTNQEDMGRIQKIIGDLETKFIIE